MTIQYTSEGVSLGDFPDVPSAKQAIGEQNKSSPTPFTSRGATQADIGKYNISNAQYPSDLYDSNEKYGGNYVIFYINVSDDSRLLQDQNNLVINDDIPVRLRGGLVGLDLSGKEATVASGVAGAITGAIGGGLLTGNLKSAGTAALAGGAIGGVAGGVTSIAADGKMARQQKRLKQAIAMHVPNQLSIRYSTEWQTEDTFAFQAAAMASREIGKAVTPENILSMMSGAESKSNVGGTIGNIATNIALSHTPGIAGALSASSGLAANPKKEQIFKNVNFREFTFDYKFSPRDSKEAKNVLEIIYLFKLHMHPEYKDKNGFLFIYPSEFDIFYYQNGKENLNLHRHTSCVLKDMNVNYTPNGVYNTFPDGMPTQIDITLSFMELAILTKENIVDKF
jgi:hypothetical protein